ncbi:GNAT family N-acetyltransferase [bacterium]|nr:GNAT family N-acetyltransferase [bacterium]
MKVLKLNTIDEFLDYNESFLTKKESFYNLILGLAYSIKNGKIELDNPLFYTIINDENRVVGAALRTNEKKNINITNISFKSIDLLIEQLNSEKIELTGVIGEENSAIYFKNQWCRLKNLSFRVNLNLGVYENREIIKPKNIYGEMIVATEENKDIAFKYLKSFYSDCFIKTPSDEDIEKAVTKVIRNRVLYFLVIENSKIVSMAGITRESVNGATISMVYTPPELRGNGYGGLIVYFLTEKIFTYKKFANLFTDLLNSTSNSIYQKLGYVKIGKNIDFEFINI